MTTTCSFQILHAVELFDHIPPECAPKICNGTHIHNQALWREFFVTLEVLRNQCVSVGQDLVSVMNEIRLTDSMGMPSRRQLYSQHRALSRALMDSELQCLRRKGQITLTRLQSLAKSISSNEKSTKHYHPNAECIAPPPPPHKTEFSNQHVSNRLKEVTAIFGEVDRAARRLEQLTEQRRERLREITRQKALEEEMKEVSAFNIYAMGTVARLLWYHSFVLRMFNEFFVVQQILLDLFEFSFLVLSRFLSRSFPVSSNEMFKFNLKRNIRHCLCYQSNVMKCTSKFGTFIFSVSLFQHITQTEIVLKIKKKKKNFK